jgi:predicted RNA-binding Zn-ribbon protein involved in translation (DUF1610 family)
MSQEQEREQFPCPNCGKTEWHADLYLPGGLRVTCIPCGWSEMVTEIERRMREGEL